MSVLIFLLQLEVNFLKGLELRFSFTKESDFMMNVSFILSEVGLVKDISTWGSSGILLVIDLLLSLQVFERLLLLLKFDSLLCFLRSVRLRQGEGSGLVLLKLETCTLVVKTLECNCSTLVGDGAVKVVCHDELGWSSVQNPVTRFRAHRSSSSLVIKWMPPEIIRKFSPNNTPLAPDLARGKPN